MVRRTLRWLLRAGLLIGGPVVIVLIGLYVYMTSGRYVTTENAYVKADLIIVAPEISGRVTAVLVEDNQIVKPGDVLFRIDAERLDVERDRRAAQLAAARQRVAMLKAKHRTKKAELEAAIADAAFEQDELERSQRLRKSGTISQFRLLEVRRTADQAKRRIDVLREEIVEALVELGGDPVMPTDRHPDVLRALADLRQAELDVKSATIRAPAQAVASNVRLQVGEYVEDGDPVMSLVATGDIWIVANLKETDLTHLEVGQTAELQVDAYPDVTWRASVASLSPATGAEYALLPAQNASGNWVKVVQRVPVRLDIEPQDGTPALRAGMSVSVSIDTRHERPLPDVLNQARAWIRTAEAK